jgi:hypothetical protein
MCINRVLRWYVEHAVAVLAEATVFTLFSVSVSSRVARSVAV